MTHERAHALHEALLIGIGVLFFMLAVAIREELIYRSERPRRWYRSRGGR